MAALSLSPPILLTLHSGELSTVWEIVAPFWSMYAERHGYELRAERIVQVGRAAQWRKLGAIAETLACGRPLLFVDADTFPVADAPDFREQLRENVAIATTVEQVDRRRVHVGLAMTWCTPDAIPIFELAQQHAEFINTTFPEESAFAAALGLKVEGWHQVPAKDWPESAPSFQSIDWAWLRNNKNSGRTETPARVWHAAGVPGKKLAMVREWLAEGRHVGQRREEANR